MRKLKNTTLNVDLAVVGGGLAGVCAAITAARGGISVALIQDRPVLGGNASSEVRLWSLGATSHMGNNNRWSREGGVIDEILSENLYRNPEGNPIFLDTILLEKVINEENITLLLNTAMDKCQLAENDSRTIKTIYAFNRQNETQYTIHAPLFCDCSGDGTLGYLAGAEFVMGKDDITRKEALQYPESFGELLGSTIFFYTKKTNQPIKYVPPQFALKDISHLKRLSQVSIDSSGCNYWWIEWAGLKNTIHDSEEIKLELWKIIYGIWDYIKNSGKYPESENYTLEWVGLIPGKRESRRFIGDYILNQKDLVEQRRHKDTVSFGGWALDHHPSDGFYSNEYEACYQWHSKGIYEVPYRCLYSKNINNLFMGGRLISTTRVAFGSTRVMMSCASNSQPIGAAAVICTRNKILPKQISQDQSLVTKLQQYLLRDGQYIPQVPSNDPIINKALTASVTTSSEYQFKTLSPDGNWYLLSHHAALIISMNAGAIPDFSIWIKSKQDTECIVKICKAEKKENYLPEIVIDKVELKIKKGEYPYKIAPSKQLQEDCYLFICIEANPLLHIRQSKQLLTGIISVFNKYNPKVAKSAKQSPPSNIGVDSFDFWTPHRRPSQNIAIDFSSPLPIFSSNQLTNGFHRPYVNTNAWVASKNDTQPTITLKWDSQQTLSTLLLFFDTDFDFAMESVQLTHPERILPFCVTDYKIYNLGHSDQPKLSKQLIYEKTNNHYTRNKIVFPKPIITTRLQIEILKVADSSIPPSVFGIQCW